MKICELVENLIQLKSDYNIRYPDDNIINLACNIIENIQNQRMTVDDWITKNQKRYFSKE